MAGVLCVLPPRRVIYVAHPLQGPDREQNRARAARWGAWVAEQGFAPVADWIWLSGEWPESRREEGLAIDLEILARCDEVWLVGGRISSGMLREAKEARRLGKVVLDCSKTGEEPPGQPPNYASFQYETWNPS